MARLPVYLRSLLELAGDSTTVSSERLAELAGVNAAKVRKDLSYLGSYGTRGVGLRRRVPAVPDEPRARPHPGLAGRHRRHRQPRPGPRQLRRLRRQRLPRRRPRRRRPGQGRPAGRPQRDPPAQRAGRARPGATRSPSASSPRRRSPPRTSPTGWSPPGSPRSSTSPRRSSPCPKGVSLRKVDLAVELQILSFYQQRRGAGEPGRRTSRRRGRRRPLPSPSPTDAAHAGRRAALPGQPPRCRACAASSSAAGGRIGQGAGLLEAEADVTVVAPDVVDGARRAGPRRTASPSSGAATTGRGGGLPAGQSRPPATRRSTAPCSRTPRPPACGSTPPTTPRTARSPCRPASAGGRCW